MKRRLLLLKTPAWLALGSVACLAWPDAHGQPAYTVSAEQLQQAVARRFPLRYPVGGLLDLKVLAPRLRLLPELNRLGTDLAVEAAGPALRCSYTGTFDLDFALRYEARDQTIRAHRLRVNSLRFPDLPPGPSELINAYAPALAEQSLGEVVLHTLQPQDLALPDAMGLQPSAITVTPKGLTISFVAKPPR
ncbi:DUF1439 domain-containing protein [soil metagenome]